MSPILVMLTLRSHSDFERSNIRLKENKPDGVDLNSNDLNICVRKKEEFYGFRQAELCHTFLENLSHFDLSRAANFEFHISFRL